MLTPIFTISQTPEFLILDIRAPYADIASTEVSIGDDEFRFFSKPYFLRLHLPERIVDTGNEVVNYDFDKKEFRVRVTKETPGEHFEGLEFISTLLTKKSSKKTTPPLIEVIGGGDDDDGDADVEEDDDGDQWLWDQTIESQRDDDEDDTFHFHQPKYGFNNKASGLFASKLSEERKEITDLPEPDSTSHSKRWRWKKDHESSEFDGDHYLADWFDEEGEIKRLVGLSRDAGSDAWTAAWKIENSEAFNDDDKFTLKNLPRREILLTSSKERRVALLAVLDVLLAAAYNFRTTEGESTVESGWTINKLSATCSCFVNFDSVFDVVVSFIRRSLTFPLCRNWDLAMKCVDDVVDALRSCGKFAVVKRLLDVYKIFVVGDPRYVLNDLYIVDMILWTQSSDLSESKMAKLTNALRSAKDRVKKNDVGLELGELEAAAIMVVGEEGVESEEDESDESEDSSGDESSSETSSESETDELERKLNETGDKIKVLCLSEREILTEALVTRDELKTLH